MKACDGQIIEFGYGSDASKTPEAFDPYGWTYERNYWLNTCELYNNGNSTGGFKYVSPCDDTNNVFISAVKQACIKRTHIWADCCREVSEECVNLQKDCNWDTCVMSTVDGNGDETLIDDNAIESFDNAMEKLCSLPPGIMILKMKILSQIVNYNMNNVVVMDIMEKHVVNKDLHVLVHHGLLHHVLLAIHGVLAVKMNHKLMDVLLLGSNVVVKNERTNLL